MLTVSSIRLQLSRPSFLRMRLNRKDALIFYRSLFAILTILLVVGVLTVQLPSPSSWANAVQLMTSTSQGHIDTLLSENDLAVGYAPTSSPNISHISQSTSAAAVVDKKSMEVQTYIRLLKGDALSLGDNYDSVDLDIFEATLWPFCTQIKAMREAALFKNKNSILKKRGIVMTLGTDQFRQALHFLAILRYQHYSYLPVEIYYRADQLDKVMREYLRTTFENVVLKDIDSIDAFKGVAEVPMELLAALASNFTQVMIADPDIVFLTEPNTLFFKYSAFKQTGTLFFQDEPREHGSSSAHHAQTGSWLHLPNDTLSSESKESPRKAATSVTSRMRAESKRGSIVALLDKGRAEVFSSLLYATSQTLHGTEGSPLTNDGAVRLIQQALESTGFPGHLISDPPTSIGHKRVGHDSTYPSATSSHYLYSMNAERDTQCGQGRKQAVWLSGSLLETRRNSEAADFISPTLNIGAELTSGLLKRRLLARSPNDDQTLDLLKETLKFLEGFEMLTMGPRDF